MQRFFWQHSWIFLAGAAGLCLLGLIAPQIDGVEDKPNAAANSATVSPAAARPAARSEDPRVAERIGLDPSVRETPALPVERKETRDGSGRATTRRPRRPER